MCLFQQKAYHYYYRLSTSTDNLTYRQSFKQIIHHLYTSNSKGTHLKWVLWSFDVVIAILAKFKAQLDAF